VRTLYALICEDAAVRNDGRVDVHGVYHQLYAPGFPAQQERMMLAVAVEWDAGEEGRQEFRIDLMDPSGSPALTISGHTDVGPRTPGEAPPQTRLIMPIERVVFPVAGSYTFELNVSEVRIPLSPIHLIENPDA
jgi:hypothetical protein